MATVFYKEINGTLAHFGSDSEGVIYEIGEYFSVFVPSAKYDFRFKNHLWDGKIRFANVRNQTIPVGLKGELKRFCADRGYDFADETAVNPFTTDSLDGFDAWLASLSLPFPPRDYQLASVKEAIKQKRLIVLSPTGSGKSYSLYLLLRWHHDKGRRVCLIVPNVSLVEQMFSDFANYSENDPNFDVEDACQLLYAKKSKEIDETKHLITTWQSLKAYSAEVYNGFDVIMCDECFDGDCKVLTPSGYIPIKNIKVGDKIINYSEKDQIFKEDEVVEVFQNMAISSQEKMFELKFDTGAIIKVTGNHEFLTQRGWVRADSLVVNDTILSYTKS